MPLGYTFAPAAEVRVPCTWSSCSVFLRLRPGRVSCSCLACSSEAEALPAVEETGSVTPAHVRASGLRVEQAAHISLCHHGAGHRLLLCL